MNTVEKIINSEKLFLIAGPCVIEDVETTFNIAKQIKLIAEKLNIQFIFKASYKKENRSKLNSFTGPGIEKGLHILQQIKQELNLKITTDVHNSNDVKKVSKIVDIIQIPAFLCRQTDILVSAAKTKKYINVKKGPFLSGESSQFIIDKIRQAGNNNICITERGNSFGYNNLVVDMRNIPIMQNYQVPVIFDATHSNQKPNQKSGVSGGTPQFIETLASSAVAAGTNGVFLETHPNPKIALSDGSNMLNISNLEPLLKKLVRIKQAIV